MRNAPYAGRILRVDLSTGRCEDLDTRLYADRFLGGRGVATAIYWNEVPPEVGAQDERNRLIAAVGPLAGIPALGGSRWVVGAKSPFPPRPHLCFGNLGGGFGAELKFAGYDGLVMQGRAARPVFLRVEPENVEISDASELWGRSATDTIEALRGSARRRARVMAVGPAGENRVPLATVLADGDASCSGGMGAVMGGKNLKAVVVTGRKRRVETADPDGLADIARQIRGFGRGNVKVWGLDFMAHGSKTRRSPCYGCMGSCLRVRYTADSGESGKFMCQSRFFYLPHAVEYYGEDNDVPFLANRLCDRYGIDTWALQDVIEWLARCHEAGVITERTSGLPLSRIGSLEFVESLVRMTALRQGFGDVLAGGARRASSELGGQAARLFARGDPYDPRYCTVNTLLFPFEPREPIQQLHEAGLLLSQWSSWAKGVEDAHISSEVLRGIAGRFWNDERAADMTTLEGKAGAARRIQRRQYAKECLVVCDWMYPVIDNPSGGDHVGDPTFESRILSAATGRRWEEEDLYRVGERVFNLQRALMLREGHRARVDDVLPPEWHGRPLEGHVADPECIVPGKDGEVVSRIGARISMPAFRRLRDEYYELMGWDVPTGLPCADGLRKLELPEVADALSAGGLTRRRARRIPPAVRLVRRIGDMLRPLRPSGKRAESEEEPEPILGEELEELMEEQRRMFGDPRVAHNFEGWNRTMQYRFTDAGEHWVIRFVDGQAQRPQRRPEPVESPDIAYEMSTATLLAMTRGELSGMQAYKQRKLRLRASFFDMMKLQSLNRADSS